MKNVFKVEGKSGGLLSISFRTRWLMGTANIDSFPTGDAVGHATCRGRVACGHSECRGRVACGNDGKTEEEIKSGIKQMKDYYAQHIEELPSKEASVFALMEHQERLLSA